VRNHGASISQGRARRSVQSTGTAAYPRIASRRTLARAGVGQRRTNTKATANLNRTVPESFSSVDLFQRQRRPLAYLRRFLRHVDAERCENGLSSALRAASNPPPYAGDPAARGLRLLARLRQVDAITAARCSRRRAKISSKPTKFRLRSIARPTIDLLCLSRLPNLQHRPGSHPQARRPRKLR
jgi:hypothetical protein